MSKESFNEALKKIIAERDRTVKHPEEMDLASDRERQLEIEVAKLCEDKPIRRIKSSWINND